MTTKHTPGPWKSDKSKYANGYIYAGRTIIAEVFDNNEIPSEANAALIAAAPEMLEALKDARATIMLMLNTTTEQRGQLRAVEVTLPAALDAIAKAEGR